MEKFNLEKALNGQAFYLQNGYRGVIKYSVEDRVTATGSTPNYLYIGYVLSPEGFIHHSHTAWDKNGMSKYLANHNATTMVEENTDKQEENQ